MLVEGTVLSLAGGLVALAVPLLTRAAVQQLVPVGVSGLEPSVLAWRLLAVTFAISVGTGLLFSLIPALHAARASMRDALQQNIRASVGGSSGRTRDALVVLQVAAALVLLVGAGLMLRTLANLRAIDLGFRSERLLTMRTVLPQPKYSDPAKRVAFFDRVIEEVRRLPGVQRAAYTSTLPFMSAGNTRAFAIEGRPAVPGDIRDVLFRVGTSDYLQTLGVQLIVGRLIDERDVSDAPLVAVINETMARMYWPGTSAIDRRIAFGPPGSQPVTIVGVVKDVRERGYELDMKPGVYVAASQMQTFVPGNLIVRVAGEPASYIRQVERIIASIDPDQPITFVRTMDDLIDTTVADRRQQMILLVAFGGVALLLVSIGLYGLLAQAVAGRSREIGLRMALGATRGLVMTMIVRRGIALTAGGITIGAAIAWGMTRLMQSLLYGVGATDPATFGAVVALLGAVAAGACALPALRAARVDPMVVLREE
jgi:predicted permease